MYGFSADNRRCGLYLTTYRSVEMDTKELNCNIATSPLEIGPESEGQGSSAPTGAGLGPARSAVVTHHFCEAQTGRPEI
jgi:hypothetical protein